jgi:hypothetical protein
MTVGDDDAGGLDAYVERIVADAPPLSADTRDRLAALLQPFTADARRRERAADERPA